jgi:short-subunit dehydrogenase involved in D-alanine esterification of teichoic acids
MMRDHIEKFIAELNAQRQDDLTVHWIERAMHKTVRDLDGEVLELQLPLVRTEEMRHACTKSAMSSAATRIVMMS